MVGPLSIFPATSVVQPRDAQHALTLLQEAGYPGVADELRDLARRIANGTLLAVHAEDPDAFGQDEQAVPTPLLTSLMPGGDHRG